MGIISILMMNSLIVVHNLWVDADRDFEVGAGELLALPEYFDIYLPGQPYEGTTLVDLSIIEYADAMYVFLSSFYPSASGIFGVGIPYTSSQAPAGPVSANALLNSSANFQLTSVSEAQFEDISGGFPLSINFTSSVLSDSAPNGTMRSDWIKLSISDAMVHRLMPMAILFFLFQMEYGWLMKLMRLIVIGLF